MVMTAKAAAPIRSNNKGRGQDGTLKGADADCAAVVTVTVNGAGSAPLREMAVGATEQLALAGAEPWNAQPS